MSGHLEAAERRGGRLRMTAQDAHRRRRTRTDGRGGIIYPLEGLNVLTGLVAAHRDIQPRGRHGSAGGRGGRGAVVHPLETVGGVYTAVRLCGAACGTLTLWVV